MNSNFVLDRRAQTKLPSNLDFSFVYFGTPIISEILLEKLLEAGHKPALVITGESKPVGRGRKLQPTHVAVLAKKHKIPVETPKSLKDNKVLKSKIINLKSKFAVLSAYGKIIPPEILNLFPLGIINPHPSLLPKYRGPSPVQSAILNGEVKTGVSVILLDEEVDHGPILAQKEIEITEQDTYESLSERLGILCAELILKLIPQLLSGTINPQIQDHSTATYTQKISRDSGFFDLDSPPDNLKNMIRAYYPWPGVWTEAKIKSDKQSLRPLQAAALKGKVIRIKLLPGGKIQVEGKKPMTLKEFLNGYPSLKEKLNVIARRLNNEAI